MRLLVGELAPRTRQVGRLLLVGGLLVVIDPGVAVLSLSNFLLHFLSSLSIHCLVSWLSELIGAILAALA